MPAAFPWIFARLVLTALAWAACLQAALGRDAPPVTRIAVASCFDQRLEQPIWPAVFRYRPEVFIYGGDNVYGSVPAWRLEPELEELTKAYAKAEGREEQQRIRRESRVMAVWDDHDMGLNDGGADMPYRQRAKDLFLAFHRVAAEDPRRTREGVYHAEVIGPPGQRVQIILLDTRWFRSPLERSSVPMPFGPYLPTADTSKTILGEAQWRWLAEQFRQPAEIRIVVSSIQLLADGHGFERWGNFPHERQRFLSLMSSTGARGVIILSGDRHIGALYRHDMEDGRPLLELTASPATRPFAANREPGPNRVGAVYGMENFGTVDIDWWARQVSLAVRGLNGEPVRRLELHFNELGMER
ncbi:MAG: hypothetical protein RI988_1412 [Pseudomonadota bacterium]|jgi:alkaline phosphatase D